MTINKALFLIGYFEHLCGSSLADEKNFNEMLEQTNKFIKEFPDEPVGEKIKNYIIASHEFYKYLYTNKNKSILENAKTLPFSENTLEKGEM